MPNCPKCGKQVRLSLERYQHRGKWFCVCAEYSNPRSCWFNIDEVKENNELIECNCGSNVKDHVPNGPYCRGV